MKGKNFISIADFSSAEIKHILEIADRIKNEKKSGIKHDILKGKTLAMVFEKPSNRTRVSFDVGMFQLGGYALNLHPSELQMGVRESVPDVSRVLSRFVDGVMMRVMKHSLLTEFAQFSSVPVINGLSDLEHPCQVLADVQTMQEHKKRLAGLRLCYIGDGNNVCRSLIQIAALLDIEIIVTCPEGYDPTISTSQAPYKIIRDPKEACKNCDVLYTDVWTSMGQEKESLERKKVFAPYQVNESLMKQATPDSIFLHCLPAHRGEEVTDEVIDSKQSVVVDQAENRLHAQKGVLALVLE